MGRPGFKPGGWRHASPGGFDSHSLPPCELFNPMKPFDLPFPEDLHYLVEHDVWARLHDDGTATVGITALGIKLSGEIYMCRVKPPGTVVEQGRAVAVVELAKAIVSVKAALSGRVIAINPRLEDVPELVHRDPYGEGWLARIEHVGGEAGEADLARLVVGGAAARAAMVERDEVSRDSSLD